MAVPESSIPPPELLPILGQLTEAMKWQAIATMTSTLISAAGRPCSIQEMLDIARDIHFAMFPAPQLGAYKEWEKDKTKRLHKVFGL